MNNLFLDDIRASDEPFYYTGNRIYLEYEWFTVRDYNGFVNHILNIGLPDRISFDHDLGDEHYNVPYEYYKDLNQFRAKYDEIYNNSNEKTGFDCAKWLVDYCIDNNKKIPKFYSHSMNPVGKEKILGLLNNFKKFQDEKINL
jgi:hypothetical protein